MCCRLTIGDEQEKATHKVDFAVDEQHFEVEDQGERGRQIH